METAECLPPDSDEPLTQARLPGTARVEATETEWGVADARGWFHGVTPCPSEQAARQHQAALGGDLVSRTTYFISWA